MIRAIEQRNYRSKIETCWEVSDQIEKCVKNSENFANLNAETKGIVEYAIGKRFLGDFIRMFGNPNLTMSKEASLFYDENSVFWTKTNQNTTNLTQLKEKCNLYALHECCKATYTLESLEGNYEYIGQQVRKV